MIDDVIEIRTHMPVGLRRQADGKPVERWYERHVQRDVDGGLIRLDVNALTLTWVPDTKKERRRGARIFPVNRSSEGVSSVVRASYPMRFPRRGKVPATERDWRGLVLLNSSGVAQARGLVIAATTFDQIWLWQELGALDGLGVGVRDERFSDLRALRAAYQRPRP